MSKLSNQPPETLGMVSKNSGATLGCILAGLSLAIILVLGGEIWSRNYVSNEIDGAFVRAFPNKKVVRGWNESSSSLNEICLYFKFSNEERWKVGMMLGDDDGGSWKFGKEYTSLSECKKHFGWG